MHSASDLDAVTVDAFGTLLELEDPTDRLRRALAARGIERDHAAVRAAFEAEVAYYRPRSLEGGDPTRLSALRLACVGVFLRDVDAPLDPSSFVEPFLASLVFRLAPGADAALASLAASGLALACVANWDASLHEQLERVGVAHRFAVVVPSAAVGVEKPDPRIFAAALRELRVRPERVLHIGDDEVDRRGARAAGLAFADPPLASLPERLGL